MAVCVFAGAGVPLEILSPDVPLVAFMSAGEDVADIMHMDLEPDDTPDLTQGLFFNLFNTLNGAWIRQCVCSIQAPHRTAPPPSARLAFVFATGSLCVNLWFGALAAALSMLAWSMSAIKP